MAHLQQENSAVDASAANVGVIRRQISLTAAGNLEDRRRRRQLIVSLMDVDQTVVDYLVQAGAVVPSDRELILRTGGSVDSTAISGLPTLVYRLQSFRNGVRDSKVAMRTRVPD